MSSVALGCGTVGATALYVLAWRRGGVQSVGHLVLWLSGIVALATALAPPLDDLGRDLLSAHLVQHLLLISAVPALLVPAVVGLREPSAGVRPMRPDVAAVCLGASILLIWGLHLPSVLEAGIRRPALGVFEHAVMLCAGVLLTWPLVGRDRVAGVWAVAFLVVAEIGLGALGIVLAWAPDLLYDVYDDGTATWGLSPETDQALAGALVLVVEEPFLAIEFAVLFIGGVLSQTGDE